jgi:hypothetical protein
MILGVIVDLMLMRDYPINLSTTESISDTRRICILNTQFYNAYMVSRSLFASDFKDKLLFVI